MCFKSFLLHKLICIAYLLKYLNTNVTVAFYKQSRLNSITGPRKKHCTGAYTYTTTHRNKTVNVYKIKHIYILYWYFKQSQCLNLRKTCATTALNTHLSYIPPMLMLKIYRPRWTQCDDNTLDPLGLVMVR